MSMVTTCQAKTFGVNQKGDEMTPKLDYVIGRTVLESRTGSNGEFRIKFDGEIIVVVEKFHEEPETMPNLSGTIFMRPIYSSSETRLQFGRVVREEGQPPVVEKTDEISVEPTEYRLVDPRFEGTTYPQRGEVEEDEDAPDPDLPADPSAERAVEAPGTPADVPDEDIRGTSGFSLDEDARGE